MKKRENLSFRISKVLEIFRSKFETTILKVVSLLCSNVKLVSFIYLRNKSSKSVKTEKSRAWFGRVFTDFHYMVINKNFSFPTPYLKNE